MAQQSATAPVVFILVGAVLAIALPGAGTVLGVAMAGFGLILLVVRMIAGAANTISGD